jgi:hypothetical protein
MSGSWRSAALVQVLVAVGFGLCPLAWEAAFAPRAFGPGKAGPVVVKVTEKNASWLAAVTDCTVTSTGASAKDKLSVSLKLRRAPSDATGVTPEEARVGAVQLKAVPVDVAGLGAGAYWVDLGSSARPAVQLNVFRGKREWLIFSASGGKLDAAAALAGLTKVAKATVARQ